MAARSNPYHSVDCHYCNAKGCMCSSPKLGVHDAECVPCDTCEGTGQLDPVELDKMARAYKADEMFKRAWRSALMILICAKFLLDSVGPSLSHPWGS